MSTGDGDGKMFTVSFVPTDVAGNVGDPLNRSDVYVDVTDIDFVRSFPFGKGDEFSGLDTIEAGTAVVVFRLSEPADSVMINYHGITQGADADSNEVDKDRSYALSGSQLTNTNSEEKYRVPGLQHDNEYVLTVTGRDLAGNWVQDGPDTFWYNEDFVVPQAAKFVVRITKPGDRETDLTALDKIKAGTPIGVNIEAQSVSGENAPTYEGTATLTVGGGRGVDLDEEKSTGATDNGDGSISLNAADWVVGERDIVFTDTVSLDNLALSIEADEDSTIVGEADSVIVMIPEAYSQILVTAPDTVVQGNNFMVNVLIADEFGNLVEDDRFVAVGADGIGVQVPPGAVNISKGTGSFVVNSSGWIGDLTVTVRDIASRDPDKAAETANTLGTATLHVRASDGAVDPSEAPAPPNGLIGEDYAGAGGDGDQGGFVMLTWGISDDHNTLDKYRIYREVAVTTGLDSAGNIVSLEEPTMAPVSWGTIDAIPGADIMRAVVATLDSDASRYAVAAERSGQSAFKQAFGVGQSVSNPYEMMAQTMAMSMEAAKPASDAPVFATLTPEALAFQEKGVLPLFKEVDHSALLSSLVYSEGPVRAIDNIPPSAVPYLKVLDTPGDAGGSIRVTWTLSPDDRLLQTIVGNAVGGSIFEGCGSEGVQHLPQDRRRGFRLGRSGSRRRQRLRRPDGLQRRPLHLLGVADRR